MFKRIDRRRKRKEAEETLGLDEDEKGVFGLHDTDSSESDTDSSESASASSSPSTTSSDRRHGTRSRNKRKRGSSSLSPSDESGGDEDGGPATDDEEVEDPNSDRDRALNPTLTLTIRSALREPVRLIRLHPEAWVCAFCPGRILKHATMVKVHEASRIHRRRFKRAQELAMEFSPDDDIQSILAAQSTTETQPKAEGATLSRRAEQRKAKQAKLKERRKIIKAKKALSIAKAKEKKAIKTADAISEHPSHGGESTKPSKRLKNASDDSPGVKNAQPTSPQAEARRKLTKAERPRKNRRKFP